ncbi:MAG: glycoside hydrolase family 2 protein [Ignavibacteriales bacterium]
MENKYLLHKGWKFALQESAPFSQDVIKPDDWYKASVPGTIHTDLLSNQLISEPFYADNETSLQWIGDVNWLYKTTFELPKDFEPGRPVYLVFEGLDTIADIFINSTNIGSVSNMFRKYTFEVTRFLKKENNILEVLFTSAVKWARSHELKHGRLPVALRSERVYIRKAQYSFGWDWGPAFITMGIWRSVYLMQQTGACIENISFDTMALEGDTAQVKIRAEVKHIDQQNCKLKIRLSSDIHSFEKEIETGSEESLKASFRIKNPKLWWPNNYGEPYLYTLSLQLLNDIGEVVDEKIRKVGIRTVSLRLNENGRSLFQFVINNKPVFCMGACWIPADTFLPRVGDEKYQKLLRSAKEANLNMIRVWGGGIYENESFYNLCDELGLMVWQDFMFACASYPDTEEFLENVKQEVKETVECLRCHSSIVLWCGNNENEWIWYQEQGKPYQQMPGYRIYHTIIPSILKKTDPGRPYWPSTPFGSDEDPNSVNSGNRHQWDIWSRWLDYKSVKDDKSLFVTEFGFQSPANYDTFKEVLPKKEREPQSRVFEFHNKQVEGPERLYRFLAAHLPVAASLKDFIYLTQLNQGFAMKECLEHWRMRFPGTNGAVIWQLNDCWPVSSWALIDSGLRPKLAYYFVKHAFSPQMVCFSRAAEPVLMVVNNSPDTFNGRLKLHHIYLPKGKVGEVGSADVEVLSDSKQSINISVPEKSYREEGILVASLYDREKKLLSRNYHTEGEWKHQKLPNARLEVKTDFTNHIVVTAAKPAFFVTFQHPELTFSDNGLIILPDEEITVPYTGPNDTKKKLLSYCLNDYL